MDEEFAAFVAARSRALCRTAYLLTGDWQAGEDLVQEALTRTYLRRGRLRGPAVLEPYARRVLVSLFLTASRRHWRREIPHPLTGGEAPGQAEPAGEREPAGGTGRLDALLDRESLWPALTALPGRQRAVLVLRYFEDLTETEIAAVLGCSPGAVKTHASRGLARLREQMDREVWSR